MSQTIVAWLRSDFVSLMIGYPNKNLISYTWQLHAIEIKHGL